MMEQNVWNYILSEFKLQSRLLMGIFSVLPKSTISLTIAGGVIYSGQEGMVQSSYFCQSSKLLKNICEKFIFNEIADCFEACKFTNLLKANTLTDT